jgi:tetratricopeptide (TPR) repeat protein
VVDKAGSASSFEAQYIAATRALKLGRYAAAMEMFEKLYKKNHKDPRILMGLAVAQQGAGFRESAANTYEDLLKIQPNNADAIVNLMGIMRAQYPSVTLKKLTELRGKYPNNPGIPAQIGLINADLKNYDDAIRYLEVAASMEPSNPTHVYNMAIVTDHAGNASKAIKLYEQALQIDAAYGNNALSLPREEIYDRLVVLRRKV